MICSRGAVLPINLSCRFVSLPFEVNHHFVVSLPSRPCPLLLSPDNLAANYSRELADYIIYVIDVAGGDKVPRKGGPGITQSDLLVVNKTDLAEAVGADLEV